MADEQNSVALEKRKYTTSDKFGIVLACLAGAMAIILFLVEKTPWTVASLLAAMVALLVYPVLHIARSAKVRLTLFACVALGTVAFGWNIWPKATTPAGRSASPSTTESHTQTGLSSPTPPRLTVSPEKLIFKDQRIGAASNAQTITATNRGSLDGTISSINTVGDFSQANDCGSYLRVGDSCNIAVVFTPQKAGLTYGSVDITWSQLVNDKSIATVAFSGSGIARKPRIPNEARTIATPTPEPQQTSKQPTPPQQQTQECAPGAQCAQTSGQTGGITAGQITVVNTPPLKLEWTSSPLSTEALPSIAEGSPQKKFKYGQEVIVTPNVAFQPVSLAIICDQEIKAVEAYGALFSPHFSLAAESNRTGLIYYEAPTLGPGVELSIGVFSDNPFNVVDVKPAKINRRKSP